MDIGSLTPTARKRKRSLDETTNDRSESSITRIAPEFVQISGTTAQAQREMQVRQSSVTVGSTSELGPPIYAAAANIYNVEGDHYSNTTNYYQSVSEGAHQSFSGGPLIDILNSCRSNPYRDTICIRSCL